MKKTAFSRLKYIFIALTCTLTISHLIPAESAHALSGSDFKAGRIIDDAIFTNSSSMDVNEIQNFLNTLVPHCDTWGQQPSEYGGGTRADYGRSKGVGPPYICVKDYKQNPTTGQDNFSGTIPEGAKSAAQIIWEAAKTYNINPQVLLVLIKKEAINNLLSDSWPWPMQYRTATGYGCPDSGPNNSPNCNTAYYGFSNQVTRAAYQFRRYLDLPNQYNYVAGRNNFILYNPQSSCGGSNVYIENAATAALYNYTPYQPNAAALSNLAGTGDACSAYGNRNFWAVFNNWFGPTVGTRVLKRDGDPTFYLLNQGKKVIIPNHEIYAAYGLDSIGVTRVSNEYIDSLPFGGTLSSLGRFNDGSIFFIASGQKYNIPALSECNAWGLECQNPYVTLTLDSDILNIPKYGGPIQPLMQHGNTIYKMQGGAKLPFLNINAITQHGYGLHQVTKVGDIPASRPLGPLLPSNGTAFRLPNGAIYTYLQGELVKIDTPQAFFNWGLDQDYAQNPPISSYDTSPPSTTKTLQSLITFGGNKFFIDSGRKINLSAVQGEWPGEVVNGDYASILLNRMPTITVDNSTAFSLPDGRIIKVAASQKRRILSIDEFNRLNLSFGNIVKLQDSLAMVPDGPNLLSPGRVFKEVGNPTLRIVRDSTSSYNIASMEQFNAFGFSTSTVYENIDSTTANAYPSASTLHSYIYQHTMPYLFAKNWAKYKGEYSAQIQWNKMPNQSFASLLGDAVPEKIMTRFAKSSDNKIYYAENGKKRHVLSLDALQGLGGSPDTIMHVYDDFLQNVPVGDPIK